MNRRCLLSATAVLAVGAWLSPAHAEFKPDKIVEIVVHNGPGSGPDVLARTLISIIEQEKLAPVRLQVVNKVGGGSTSASAYLTSKKGDPHVIAVYTNVWIVDALTQEAAKTRLQDLTPITRLMVEPALIAVPANSPFKTMQDFITAAKEKPGALKQSGGSVTSRDNILRQLLMQSTGARWNFISFPSGGERLAALLGGHVELMIMDPSEAGEHARAGKLRMIAQVGGKRLPGFENVPTLSEQGFKLPDVPQTRGIVGPAGMSADAVAYYESLFEKVTKTAGWQKFLTDSQLEPIFTQSAETQKFLVRFEGQLRDILKEAGAKVVR